jgi:hypothetical protein
LTQELESFKLRNSKLEKEADHYKRIYGELTQRYNKEKSEKIINERQSRMSHSSNQKVWLFTEE